LEDSNLSEKLPIIATGRRKKAVAQVQLLHGTGQFTINGKDSVTYLQNNASSLFCVKAPFNLLKKAPFELLNLKKEYDLIVKVKGGGFLGQAEAIQLGISRALCEVKQIYRGALKQEGLLRRDSRSKERKKYGLKKARKAPQYSKR
jgi:small subunit ribosomal protein S9